MVLAAEVLEGTFVEEPTVPRITISSPNAFEREFIRAADPVQAMCGTDSCRQAPRAISIFTAPEPEVEDHVRACGQHARPNIVQQSLRALTQFQGRGGRAGSCRRRAASTTRRWRSAPSAHVLQTAGEGGLARSNEAMQEMRNRHRWIIFERAG